jgi:hypothetical protein
MLNNRTRRDVIFNRVPTKADLDAGDLVVNAGDGTAYTKLVTGQVVPIAGRSISGDSSGSSFELPIATDTVLGGIKVGANLSITAEGVLSAQQGQDGFVLPPATRSTLGGVIVGARLTVGPDGTLSADAPALPIASNTVLGGVRVGSGLTIDGSGLLSANAQGYTLPPATNVTLGGIKVGTNLTVTADGTLNAGPSGSDRVLRAGDTMTGTLNIANANLAVVNGRVSVTGTMEPDVVVGPPATPTFGSFYYYANTVGVQSRGTLHLATSANTSVVIAPDWNEIYRFSPSDVWFERNLVIQKDTTGTALFILADQAGIANIDFYQRDFNRQWGAVGSALGRTDLWGRQQAWLRAGVEDGWGHAEINGGWREWEAIRFSRGGQWLGSIDGNGNYINKVSRVEALPAPVAGLDVVLQLHPVVLASGAADDVERPPSLGFLPTELRRAVPEAVSEDESGYCATALIPVLVKAIQELTARVAALEAA